MPVPLDLQRLAFRIETLMRMDTHGWSAGDELEFRNGLPNSRTNRKLPDPKTLRAADVNVTEAQYHEWIHRALQMESLAHRNHPHNTHRIVQDMIRGRLPLR